MIMPARQSCFDEHCRCRLHTFSAIEQLLFLIKGEERRRMCRRDSAREKPVPEDNSPNTWWEDTRESDARRVRINHE